MTTPRRQLISTPGTHRDPSRRGPGAVLVSLLAHVLGITVLVRILVFPVDWARMMGVGNTPPVAERIGFLALPKGDPNETEPARSGGNGRPIVQTNNPTPSLPPLVAPTIVPNGLPDLPRPFRPGDEEQGSGPIVGTGGPARGIRPQFTDPRVWAPGATVVQMPLTGTRKLDSTLATRLGALNDSLAQIPKEREPGDWTFERDGKKYGIDGKYIRLGKFQLPTAALALLPLNQTANPGQTERARVLTQIRSEILDQAARGARDDDFRAAVKALRERKDKERAAAKKDAGDTKVPGTP